MHLKGCVRSALVCALAFAFSNVAFAQHAAKDNNAGDAQTVAKDNNGNLRKPTAEEQAELTNGKKQDRTPLTELQKTVTKSGAVGYVTDESYETSVVATRDADGKLTIACDDNHDAQPAQATKTKKKSKPAVKKQEVPRAEAQ